MRNMWLAGMLALAVGAGTLTAQPAQASVSGRRNTALGLGAAAIYELTRGNTVAGIALGAGAAYSYKRSRDEQRWENRYDDYRYRDGYRPLRNDGYRGWSDRDNWNRGDRYNSDGDDRCRDGRYNSDRDDRYRDNRYNYDRREGWRSRR